MHSMYVIFVTVHADSPMTKPRKRPFGIDILKFHETVKEFYVVTHVLFNFFSFYNCAIYYLFIDDEKIKTTDRKYLPISQSLL